MGTEEEVTSPSRGGRKLRSNFRVGGTVRGSGPHPKNPSDFSTSPQGGGQVVAAARAWIGTPYLHQASVKGAGCDCLGLLRGVWRELFGAEPEALPPYSSDWAEATGEETLCCGLARHLKEIAPASIAAGDIALFRMVRRGPAKHCGIVAVRNGALTMIHARHNKRVSEERLSQPWRRKLAFAFRLPAIGSRP
jgi:NlpC/P60 family putative phage cell wall peptidase